ncbi:MAG: hypothetical protein ABSH34_05070 [Verrucomicrobiota bacterium]|jgi:hypothetical protein
MDIASLSPQQLRKAADLKENIDALEEQLNELLGSAGRAFVGTEPLAAIGEPGKPQNGRRKKRRMTAAWKRALSLARKARLARIGLRVAAEPGQRVEKTTTARSAAWRKAKSKAMKAFWAARRAAGKTAL